jgi:hypothetical protein
VPSIRNSRYSTVSAAAPGTHPKASTNATAAPVACLTQQFIDISKL